MRLGICNELIPVESIPVDAVDRIAGFVVEFQPCGLAQQQIVRAFGLGRVSHVLIIFLLNDGTRSTGRRHLIIEDQ